MKQRILDGSGDWVFGVGIQAYGEGLDGVRENVTTRVKSFKTDSFTAPEEGVDYLNLLDRGTKELLDRDIKRVILQSADVIGITAYEGKLNNDDRNYQISATIATVYGVQTIELGV